MKLSDLVTQAEEISQKNISAALKNIYLARLNHMGKTLDIFN